MKKITSAFFVLFLCVLSLLSYASSTEEIEQLVLGDHVLTLQWLMNANGIGKAKITKEDSKILIDGYQEEKYEGNLNTLTIKGTLTIINEKELLFEGKIVTKINYINNGIPYERNGKFTLKATGSRKYWRMQNMTQPDGNSEVTDYIDIYFEKFKKSNKK